MNLAYNQLYSICKEVIFAIIQVVILFLKNHVFWNMHILFNAVITSSNYSKTWLCLNPPTPKKLLSKFLHMQDTILSSEAAEFVCMLGVIHSGIMHLVLGY
jgi:hypothetical protein